MFGWLKKIFGLGESATSHAEAQRVRDPFPGRPDCHDPQRDAYYAKLEAERKESAQSRLRRQTAQSVDPGGLGVPHNTERNRHLNSIKSTEQIDAEIEQRNAACLPTWQLRQERARRMGEG